MTTKNMKAFFSEWETVSTHVQRGVCVYVLENQKKKN